MVPNENNAEEDHQKDQRDSPRQEKSNNTPEDKKISSKTPLKPEESINPQLAQNRARVESSFTNCLDDPLKYMQYVQKHLDDGVE